MRKIRKLSFFGVLGVVIAVLFLISISFMQAQVQTQGKPDKPPGKPEKPPKPEDPPDATWAVRIPTSGNMFYGVGDGYYDDNDSNVVVSVEKNSPGAWRRYFDFTYAFDFTITNENVGTGNPSSNQVGFENVPALYEVSPENSDLFSQFPQGFYLTDFLYNAHPYSDGIVENDYEYFWFRVNIFDQDIELMGIGDHYVFGSGPDAGEPGDYLSVMARYRQECYPEPAYHDVELYRNINESRALELGNPLNIEIERLDETTYDIDCDGVWRFWVHDTGFLKVKERYCTIEKNKTKWYYPMEAKANFSFYIDWIKNPTIQ
jgi:hypothetical protein